MRKMNAIKLFTRTANTLSKMKRYKVGDIARMKRKISRDDLERFIQLSGDSNPIHSQEKPIVHGAFLNSLVSAVIGNELPGPGTLVVAQNLNFPNKCFADEEVTVTVELTEDRKILKVRFACEVEEQSKIVLYGDASLVKNR